MNDLEKFVNQPGRDKLVKEVRKKINDLGITYIYYQFISVTGRIVGKGVPADHWETLAAKGFQLVYGSTANLFIDRHGDYIGYGPEASELVGIAEPETFVQIPWDKRLARVFCTCFRNREEEENPGGHLTSDCRGNLKIFQDEFKEKYGMHLRAGTEPEMMWLTKKDNGEPTGDGFSRPYCYHIDQFESLRPVYMKVIEYASAMGLDVIQGDHEDAPGQLELNFMYDEVLRNADRLSTYRQICAQVAREHNLIACFMSKPFMGVSANGCHTNVSLWKGGTLESTPIGNDPLPGMPEVFTHEKGGENMFMPDPNIDPVKPGPVGLNSIGGLLQHLPALTCLGSPTVNSYRRLWDQGFWAPVYADWGYQNRTCSVRVSAPGRVEYRSVDSAHNPYLLGAGILKAFGDGLDKKLDPGEPEKKNIYEAMKAGKKVDKLPMTLGEAIDRLENDEVIKSALPDEMHRVFMHYKKDEWEKFLSAVLVRGFITQTSSEASLISFNLFNLYLVMIFFMFLLSIIFTRSIIRPIKTLSSLVKIEQDKFNPPLSTLNYPVRNDEIGGLSDDIKNMSKELKSQINELEKFSADVAHELKNPLAGLKTSNELLAENKIKLDDRKLLFNNIINDLDRMNRLISDISDYTRTQVEMEKQKFNEFELIYFLNDLKLSFAQNNKKINILFNFTDSKIIVQANMDKLAQVFINLIENAISFSPPQSNVLIQIVNNNDKVIIYVVDQGCGVNVKLKDKIFERFYTDRPDKNDYHTGLGLSISKKIMESFGGSIELSDKIIDNYIGACFKLELPIKA